MRKEIYIASCDEQGGIYRYGLNPDGKLEKLDFTPMDKPMYMVKKQNKMYVLLKSPFKDSNESGLVVYDINEGKLENPSEIVSTKGEVACHLAVDGDDVYCVNYVSGSVIKMPGTLVTHSGKGIHPTRQESPHTHFVGFTPDKNNVVVTDLGLDTIFIYDRNLNLKKEVKVPEGHGVRHLIYSDDGKYLFAVNELKSTVSVFDENFHLIETVNCLPDDFDGYSIASAIRYEKDFVYMANRGHDSVTVLKHSGKKLEVKGIYPCYGNGPRDFDIFGRFIICTNEKSDSVTVLEKEGMSLVFEEKGIKGPLCVIS